jgi:hypothetical protein
MRSNTSRVICAQLAVLGLSIVAASSQQSASTATSINPLSQAERAANLFGRELMGSDNQKVGKVDNLVVDLEQPREGCSCASSYRADGRKHFAGECR